MTDRAHIRVTLTEDGRTPQRELFVDGHKVADLSFVDVISLVMQATSSLRFETEKKR